MPRFGYQNILYSSTADGTAKTATGIATILPTPLYTLPENYFDYPGKKLRISMFGRISCVVITPGTVRLALRLGAVSVYDSGALNLNVVAKTNVPWWFDLDLVCRAVGASATLFGRGEFRSEAVVGSALPSAGSNGSLQAPVGTPAVGTSFNSANAQVLDIHHTQTAATGSIQVHHYVIEDPN